MSDSNVRDAGHVRDRCRWVSRCVAGGLALWVVALAMSCVAGEMTVAASGGTATIELPGGQAKLTLVKCWGRAPGSSRPWTLAGDKLPTMTVKADKEFVNVWQSRVISG